MMTTPAKSCSLELRHLTLSKETLAGLTEPEAEIALGGAATAKTKTHPRTFAPICEPHPVTRAIGVR